MKNTPLQAPSNNRKAPKADEVPYLKNKGKYDVG